MDESTKRVLLHLKHFEYRGKVFLFYIHYVEN